MTIELQVEAGEQGISAPVETVEAAAILASQFIDAGATQVRVSETVSGASEKGAEAEEEEEPRFTMTYGEDGVSVVEGSAMQQAILSVDQWREQAEEDSEFSQSGDAGSDALAALSTADRWLDTNIFGSQLGQQVLGALPYGNIIQDAHDIRRGAMGEPSARTRQREQAARAGRERAAREARAGREQETRSRDTERMVRQAQAVTRAARRGEEPAMARVRRIKEQAAAGDPEARRMWKIYVAVADDDQQRIEGQL